MALSHHPNIGDVLVCEFPGCLEEPEMIKRRPVVVISRQLPGRPKLCTVVPLSTTAPHPVQKYHFEVATPDVPKPFDSPTKWVKGDMVYTLSIERMARFKVVNKTTGQRSYVTCRLSLDDLKAVKECIRHGLSLVEKQ